MIAIDQLRRRARSGWHLAQARLLIAQVDRRQARRRRLKTSQPYDELRCPWFLGALFLAALVVAIDVGDSWSAVIALFASMATGA